MMQSVSSPHAHREPESAVPSAARAVDAATVFLTTFSSASCGLSTPGSAWTTVPVDVSPQCAPMLNNPNASYQLALAADGSVGSFHYQCARGCQACLLDANASAMGACLPMRHSDSRFSLHEQRWATPCDADGSSLVVTLTRTITPPHGVPQTVDRTLNVGTLAAPNCTLFDSSDAATYGYAFQQADMETQTVFALLFCTDSTCKDCQATLHGVPLGQQTCAAFSLAPDGCLNLTWRVPAGGPPCFPDDRPSYVALIVGLCLAFTLTACCVCLCRGPARRANESTRDCRAGCLHSASDGCSACTRSCFRGD
jgi:hypothetical protein